MRNIEEAVATWLPWDLVPRIMRLAANLRRRPETDLLQQVGECIGRPGTATLNDLRDDFGEAAVRESLATAMQSKDNAWFKTLEGGQALGELLLEIGVPPRIQQVFRAFWHRVRQESGWA